MNWRRHTGKQKKSKDSSELLMAIKYIAIVSCIQLDMIWHDHKVQLNASDMSPGNFVLTSEM